MFKVIDPSSSIYVELRINGQAHMQEFAPTDERAFVVGSTDRASLRVNGVGIAPVQFHVEREDGAIWLIPAYGIADLSADGFRVLGPTPLNTRSAVEFCGVRIDVTIAESDGLATNDDRQVAQKQDSNAIQQARSLGSLGDEEPTVVALRPGFTNEPARKAPTHVDETRTRPERRGAGPSHDPRSGSPRSAEEHAAGNTLESAAPRLGNRVNLQHRAPTHANARMLLVVGVAGIGVLVLGLSILVAVRLNERARGRAVQDAPKARSQ